MLITAERDGYFRLRAKPAPSPMTRVWQDFQQVIRHGLHCRDVFSFILPQENAEGNDLYERAERAPKQSELPSIRDVLIQVQPQSTLAQ